MGVPHAATFPDFFPLEAPHGTLYVAHTARHLGLNARHLMQDTRYLAHGTRPPA
jgi:hypothetical protein